MRSEICHCRREPKEGGKPHLAKMYSMHSPQSSLGTECITSSLGKEGEAHTSQMNCKSGNLMCPACIGYSVKEQSISNTGAHSSSASEPDRAVMFDIFSFIQSSVSFEDLCSRLWTSRCGCQFIPLSHKMKSICQKKLNSKQISTIKTILVNPLHQNLQISNSFQLRYFHFVPDFWGWLFISVLDHPLFSVGFPRGSLAQLIFAGSSA